MDYIAAVAKHGTMMRAAKALKMPKSTFSDRWRAQRGLARADRSHGNNAATRSAKFGRSAPVKEGRQANEPFRLGGTAQDRKVVELTEETTRLRNVLRAMHKQELNAQAIREIIGSLARAPIKKPNWLIPTRSATRGQAEVPVTIWSDWHAGEKVEGSEVYGANEYSIEVMERRVRRLVSTTIDLCKNHGPGNYPGIVINLLGDFVSGALHPELAKTDEEEILPTVLRVREILVWALDEMIKAFGFVYAPCASGNHGRSTLKPEFKRYVFKNYDWLIYQMLIAHYRESPNAKRILFDVNDDNEVLYSVWGQRYLAVHGDMLGVKGGDGIVGSLGPVMRGEMKVGKQAASAGRDYDVLLMGHWHQAFYLPRVIVASSLKGADEYSKNVLRAIVTTPSQPLWFVHPKWGRTAYREVFVEDPVLAARPEWVSWKSKPSRAYVQPQFATR